MAAGLLGAVRICAVIHSHVRGAPAAVSQNGPWTSHESMNYSKASHSPKKAKRVRRFWQRKFVAPSSIRGAAESLCEGVKKSRNTQESARMPCTCGEAFGALDIRSLQLCSPALQRTSDDREVLTISAYRYSCTEQDMKCSSLKKASMQHVELLRSPVIIVPHTLQTGLLFEERRIAISRKKECPNIHQADSKDYFTPQVSEVSVYLAAFSLPFLNSRDLHVET